MTERIVPTLAHAASAIVCRDLVRSYAVRELEYRMENPNEPTDGRTGVQELQVFAQNLDNLLSLILAEPDPDLTLGSAHAYARYVQDAAGVAAQQYEEQLKRTTEVSPSER